MSDLLFGRRARILVGELEVVSAYPRSGLRVAFNITKTLKPEPNTCEIRIWNLSENQRTKLETQEEIPVQIEAGYEEPPLLFIGHVRKATSETEGTDIITTLASGDGEKAFKGARVNVTIPKGTPVSVAVEQIAKSLNLGEGNFKQLTYQFAGGSAVFSNGTVLSGSASREMTHLMQSLGKEWSIQDETLQVLDRGKALEATAILLNKNTGMLGSPSIAIKEEKGKKKTILNASMLMIPDVFPGRLMVVESRHASGNYRIERCDYSGDTRGDDWRIDLEATRL